MIQKEQIMLKRQSDSRAMQVSPPFLEFYAITIAYFIISALEVSYVEIVE